MARSYGVLKVSMWEPRSDFRELSLTAQWAYMMLLSQPQINNLGLLAYTPEKWVRLSPSITLMALSDALSELEESRHLMIDLDTGELLVRTFIKHDRVFMQPALTKNARTLIPTVESDAIRSYLLSCHPWLDEEGWFTDAPEFDPDPKKNERLEWDKAKIKGHEDAVESSKKTPLARVSRGVSSGSQDPSFEMLSGPQDLDAGSGVGSGVSSREEDQLQELGKPAAAEKDSGDELEAPRLAEVQQAVDDLGDHDEGTIRQVEPLALAVPRTVFRDVIDRHKRRLADGDVRNQTGLFVDLLRKTVKSYARAIEMAQLDVQKTPLDDVLSDCRYYAARSIPWEAAEPLIAMKFKRWELPDADCQEIIDEAKRAYLTVAA